MKTQHRLLPALLLAVSTAAIPQPLDSIAREDPARLLVRDESRTIITDPETGRMFVAGETSTARTIYTVVGLLCAVILALFLGFRAKTLKNNVLRKTNLTSILVLLLFFFGLSFILCTAVVETGQGLYTHRLCYSAAMICLVFYTGNKLAIYLFLLERARIVRAPFCLRHKDYLWISGITIIVGGFGAIAIIGYMSPIVELSKLDGRCRIGLPSQVSIPLLSFDVGVNCLLTGVFLWLLRPVLSSHNIGLGSLGGCCGGRFKATMEIRMGKKGGNGHLDSGNNGEERSTNAINRNIKSLLRKSLIGSLCIMLPTVGNMAQFYIMKGRELGWICLTICTLDVSWGILVINWLTIGSAEAESNLATLMSRPTISEAEQPLSSRTVDRSREGSVMTHLDVPVFIRQPAGAFAMGETSKSVGVVNLERQRNEL